MGFSEVLARREHLRRAFGKKGGMNAAATAQLATAVLEFLFVVVMSVGY
jgi:hypothetical protein